MALSRLFAAAAGLAAASAQEVGSIVDTTQPPTLPPVTTPYQFSEPKKPLPSCSSTGTAWVDENVKHFNGGILQSAADCQTSCSQAPYCSKFTYYDNSGACWLQGEDALPVESQTAVSGPKTCGTTATPTETTKAQTTTLFDGPLPGCSTGGNAWVDENVPSVNGGFLASAAACQNSCYHAPHCSKFTFYRDTGACWLQGDDAHIVDSPLAVSGPKLCSTCYQTGKKWVDESVQHFNGGHLPSAEACQNSCQHAPYCSKFTYYQDTNACWLQGEDATLEDAEDATAIAGPKERCPEETEEAGDVDAAGGAATGRDVTGDEGGAFPWWWILIGALALAAIGAAAYFLCCKKAAKATKAGGRGVKTTKPSTDRDLESEPLVGGKPDLFDQIDRDGNGEITREEFARYYGQQGAQGAAPAYAMYATPVAQPVVTSVAQPVVTAVARQQVAQPVMTAVAAPQVAQTAVAAPQFAQTAVAAPQFAQPVMTAVAQPQSAGYAPAGYSAVATNYN